MTKFDIIVLALLAVSGAVGFVRGAVREIVALFALVAAAALAVLGLPHAASVFRSLVHPPWLGTVAALVVVFGVTYVVLRLLGAALAQRIQSTQMVRFLDRSFGLLLGLLRGLMVLGALFLMFNAATPADLQPRWITGAATWPLARNMGRLLQQLAPQGLDMAGRLRPAFERAVRDGSGDRSVTDSYEARGHGWTDDPKRSP